MSSLNQTSKSKRKSKSIEGSVLKVLEEIRPGILAHGGNVELVSVKGGQITIRILGACVGCSMAYLTFGEEMEKEIKKKVPEVKKIKFVS